jgi:hypothetical protein
LIGLKEKIPIHERMGGKGRVSMWMLAHRKSVPEHPIKSRLDFETTPPNTLFEGTTISLLLEKIATFDMSDG